MSTPRLSESESRLRKVFRHCSPSHRARRHRLPDSPSWRVIDFPTHLAIRVFLSGDLVFEQWRTWTQPWYFCWRMVSYRCHGQVADFRPQILFKIKQNVVKTLVNSDLYTIIKKGHFSFLAEKSCLGTATVSILTASSMRRQLPSPAKL